MILVATSEVPLENNVELECMQVNVLKNVTRITKRGYGIRTDQFVGSDQMRWVRDMAAVDEQEAARHSGGLFWLGSGF